eukprot:gnl/MRDRNA2_/MRDRNA2_137372_c0_seq1.p1 gnl/MRDRNA2_/MRDRNA2_137372_c0~~gnl/MRDRNA2_/MRDRNA2_137372_c0_seq1.p1  ORF type:complete len:254 (+),score=42.84 gnl/MRDRNA2_/MRDRNA2_137372_c0_seq1:41-763(+)
MASTLPFRAMALWCRRTCRRRKAMHTTSESSPKESAMKGNSDLAEASQELLVTARMMNGECVTVPALQTTEPLSKLQQRIAEAFGVSADEIRLCTGTELLTLLDEAKTLAELKIDDALELNVIMQPKVGESRYNVAYKCVVKRVDQIRPGVVALKFEVTGDMSLGELQNPSTSQLLWWDKEPGSGSHWQSVRPVSEFYEHRDNESCIKGTLVYEKVPTQEELFFRYGSSGYSKLKLPLNE